MRRPTVDQQDEEGRERERSVSSVELACRACGTQLRITPKRVDLTGKHAVRCPRCRSIIEFELDTSPPTGSATGGWSKLGHDELFGTYTDPPTPLKPKKTPPLRAQPAPAPEGSRGSGLRFAPFTPGQSPAPHLASAPRALRRDEALPLVDPEPVHAAPTRDPRAERDALRGAVEEHVLALEAETKETSSPEEERREVLFQSPRDMDFQRLVALAKSVVEDSFAELEGASEPTAEDAPEDEDVVEALFPEAGRSHAPSSDRSPALQTAPVGEEAPDASLFREPVDASAMRELLHWPVGLDEEDSEEYPQAPLFPRDASEGGASMTDEIIEDVLTPELDDDVGMWLGVPEDSEVFAMLEALGVRDDHAPSAPTHLADELSDPSGLIALLEDAYVGEEASEPAAQEDPHEILIDLTDLAEYSPEAQGPEEDEDESPASAPESDASGSLPELDEVQPASSAPPVPAPLVDQALADEPIVATGLGLGTLPLVLVGGVVLAVALGLVTQDWGDGASSPEGAQAAGAVVEVSPVALDMEQALAEHIASAQAIVARGLTQDPSDPWVRRDVGTELLGEGAYPAAARIFQGLSEERPEDHEVRVLTARALAGMGEYKGARELLLAGLVVAPEHEETTRAFQDMIKEDPNLHPPVMTLGVDMQIDTMRKLGGGRSVSMRLVRDGETRYAFKPSQLQWEEGWRAEIAAYLLCEVLPCRFKVPKNIPLRISKQDFERLYLKNTPKQRLYAERFEELLWVVEPGPDGVEREYLYGTAKEWVPKFVDWPIEYTDIWSPWLKANAQRWVLRQKLNQAIWNLRKVQDGRYYRLILSQRAESTTREIAHQLSDILVFDYLTNNFDRFSQREEFYGVNNQFRAGTFVSLDNGAAFYGTEQLRTKQRFELTERFSRHMVAALRAIDPESMGPVFFPDPSEKAKRRLEIFWKRRDAAIARVDRLVERHGAPKVLYFP